MTSQPLLCQFIGTVPRTMPREEEIEHSSIFDHQSLLIHSRSETTLYKTREWESGGLGRSVGWRATVSCVCVDQRHSDIVTETERRWNSIVHLWVRYWVRVASGLSPKKWLYMNRLICWKNKFLKFWWSAVYSLLIICSVCRVNKHYLLNKRPPCYISVKLLYVSGGTSTHHQEHM